MPGFEKQSSSILAGLSSLPPALLIVGYSEARRTPLKRVAESFGWSCLESAGCGEAMTLLRREHISVVVCEQHLPDGNWRSLLEEIGGLTCQPHVIVASELTDPGLWAEVLNLGAYDVLMLPFDDDEVRRVVSFAWESKGRELAGRTGIPQSAVQAA